MSETFTDPTPETEFYRPTVAHTALEALYGRGVAVMTWLGISQAQRDAMLEVISYSAPSNPEYWGSGSPTYYSDFDPEHPAVRAITDTILDGIHSVADQRYVPINLQYNDYTPGTGIEPHYDSGEHYAVPQGVTHWESLSIIYMVDGSKQLQVWPETAESGQAVDPIGIQQHPDMLSMHRGTALEHKGRVHPAVLHAVPPVPPTDGPSSILTFDLLSAEVYQQAYLT